MSDCCSRFSEINPVDRREQVLLEVFVLSSQTSGYMSVALQFVLSEIFGHFETRPMKTLAKPNQFGMIKK